jgi:hypothetical protein
MTNNDDTGRATSTIIDLDPDQVVEDGRPAPSAPEPAPAKTTSSKRFLLWSVAALAAAAIGGGWFYRDVLSIYLPSDHLKLAQEKLGRMEADNKALHEDVARLEKLTGTLSDSFNALESKTATQATAIDSTTGLVRDSEAQLAALDAGLKDTKKAIADLSSRTGLAPAVAGAPVDGTALTVLTTRIDALEKDVASLKTSQGSGAADTAVLSQSLADLKAKIASGAGFGPELERIQRLAPAAPGLDVLASSAAQGLPNAKGLALELTGLADTLPKPEAAVEESGGSMLSNAWKALSSLVRVRNIGEADWPAAARSAATLAEQGEVRQAIDQLNAVEGTKPTGLAQWLERADARLKLDAAVGVVSEAVMRVIAAKG